MIKLEGKHPQTVPASLAWPLQSWLVSFMFPWVNSPRGDPRYETITQSCSPWWMGTNRFPQTHGNNPVPAVSQGSPLNGITCLGTLGPFHNCISHVWKTIRYFKRHAPNLKYLLSAAYKTKQLQKGDTKVTAQCCHYCRGWGEGIVADFEINVI